jgi:hypothetical protein
MHHGSPLSYMGLRCPGVFPLLGRATAVDIIGGLEWLAGSPAAVLASSPSVVECADVPTVHVPALAPSQRPISTRLRHDASRRTRQDLLGIA